MGFECGIRTLDVMLNLFQSNRMPELSRAFCERNAVFADPFEPLTVVVQSFGLGQWLKLQLSEHHGFSGNVDSILPATFLWKLYQAQIPESGMLNESPYDRARLSWRIMRLLKQHPDLGTNLSSYLSAAGDPDLRLMQLSDELALLFDEYLMYRPDWILGWEKGSDKVEGHEAWQADLWRLIQEDLGDNRGLHRAALHTQVLAALQRQPATTWKRISIFGLSTLPPLQLETFEALAQSIEVDIYFLNPCGHYWGDIISEKDKARRSIRSLLSAEAPLSDEDYLEVGNPLLSSLGKQGREFLELLLGSNDINSEEFFLEEEESTALAVVKNDILNLTLGGEFGTESQPTPRTFNDTSIQIHICHSRLREVEVLHDQILHTIAQNPELRLTDILVMVPNISDYAPFIQSVFPGSLGFRIADRGSVAKSTLLTSFIKLLSLPELRISGPEVMDLLEVPAVMARFELSPDDLETIAHWIEEAGIRWELNGQNKAEFWNLPVEHQNTWQFGLDRLLLGFAMSPEQGSWEGILPFEVTPADTDLLGKLCCFIDLLGEFRKDLNEDRPVSEWQQLITHLVQTFYDPRVDEVLEVNQVLQIVDELSRDAVAGAYEDPVSRQAIVHTINQALSGQDSKAGFISGGITFATLVPMRSIPFRMIALLGMNDGEYPRDVRPHSFDLIASQPSRKGDRSKKLDDRYLFLEALISAQEIFYVSYVGKGARDNKDRPPSSVVSEWLSYLKVVFDQDYVTTHSLQPFNQRYYQGDRLQSFSTTWFQALTGTDEPPVFAGGALPLEEADTCSSVAQLSRFYRHPGKYFLQQKLGVWFEEDDAELKDIESFELDALERYQIADAALAVLMDEGDLEQYREQVSLSGTLLPGKIGEQHLDREIARAEHIRDRVTDYLNASRTLIKSDIDIAGTRLSVEADNLYGSNIINYRVGRLGARHLFEGWIQHLAVNLVRPETSTLFVFQDRKKEAGVSRLTPVDPVTAEATLDALLSLYHEGVTRPLLLPPEACQTFADTLRKGADRETALLKARQGWASDQPGAEGNDRYWTRLFELPAAFQERFTRDTEALWLPLLEAITDE